MGTTRRGGSNLCFEQKYEKNIRVFLSEKFQFLEVKLSIYLNRRVFVMGYIHLLAPVWDAQTQIF